MIDTYVLPGETVFPEGIAAGPAKGEFFVSSARQGTVFRGTVDHAEVAVWLEAGADGRTCSLGMAMDRHGRLIICGGETGRLYAYDTATGALLATRVVAAPTLLNDVCVVGDAAYVTDSSRPVVWRWPLGTDPGEVELWADLAASGASAEETHFLNGIVPTRDGSALLVAAQGTGVLWRVGLADASAAVTDLGGSQVHGDGLAWLDDTLYACDNTDEADGSARFWLTALAVDPDGRAGRVHGRWERPADDTPTTATVVDGRLLLVNSQFWAERRGRARPPFTVSALDPPSAS